MPSHPSRKKTLQALLAIFAEAKFSWFSSVRPNGHPHSVPIWHVMHEGRLYFATAANSVKATNILANPHVVVGAYLDNPESGLIVEGVASLRPELRPTLSPSFEQKYEWSIQTDDHYNTLIEVEPERLIAWGQYGEGRWTGDEIGKAVGRKG